jgi:tetratricopeptide (TPR) repeat protein
MKKFILLAIAVLNFSLLHAQKSKGFDAQSYLRDYNSTQDVTSLNHAKESIDIAAENAETKDNPFILVTKGQIYMALYDEAKKTTEKTVASVTDEQKRALAVYENTPTDNLETAYQAFLKAKQVDVKGKYSDDTKAITTIGMYFDYSGRAKFNAQKFAEALTAFERAYEINNTDTTVLYFAAISADYSGNFLKAKEYYTKMVDTKQARPNTYTSLVNTYFALKDTAGGMVMLKKGIQEFPANANLLLMEVNYYLKLNKGEEVLDGLNTAITANPDNINLFLARGNVHDNIATHLMTTTSDAVKQKQWEASVIAAEKDYLKVLALDSNNYYALFNLGILYFNKGVVLNNKANDEADNLKFKAINTQANNNFKNAMPLLEKALKQQPGDRNLMVALKQVYARLELTDKQKMMDEKLKR